MPALRVKNLFVFNNQEKIKFAPNREKIQFGAIDFLLFYAIAEVIPYRLNFLYKHTVLGDEIRFYEKSAAAVIVVAASAIVASAAVVAAATAKQDYNEYNPQARVVT